MQRSVVFSMQFLLPLQLVNSMLHHIHSCAVIVCRPALPPKFEWLLLKYYSAVVVRLMYSHRFAYETEASLLSHLLLPTLSSSLPTFFSQHGTSPLLQTNYCVH